MVRKSLKAFEEWLARRDNIDGFKTKNSPKIVLLGGTANQQIAEASKNRETARKVNLICRSIQNEKANEKYLATTIYTTVQLTKSQRRGEI